MISPVVRGLQLYVGIFYPFVEYAGKHEGKTLFNLRHVLQGKLAFVYLPVKEYLINDLLRPGR